MSSGSGLGVTTPVRVPAPVMDSRALRVACVVDEMRLGGAERVCAQLAEGIRRNGGFASVVELVDECGATSRSGRARTLWRLVRRFRAERINLVHVHNSAALVYAFGPARLLGLPIVVTRHGSLVGQRPRLVRLADRLLPLADRVVVVAETLRAALPRGVRPGRFVHIPNGVATNRIDREFGRQRLHELTRATEDAEWIVNVGTISPEKNQPGIVRAFAKLASARPSARLVLVGQTRCELTLREVMHAAKTAGLGDRVHVVGPQNEIPVLLSGADAFVLGSITEAMPMALLEAMVQACPIAATRVGDVPRMIRHGDEGLLVRAGDDASLADALATLLSERPFATCLGEAARARACESYSEDRTIREHLRVYASIAGVHGNGA